MVIRMRLFRVAVLALVVMGVTGSAGAGESDVIAHVGTTDVDAAQLKAYIAALDPRIQAAIAARPALLDQTVRALLAQQLVLQELQAKKWDQQPAVAAALDRVRNNAAVELYLQSLTQPPTDYPSEADVQSAYDANKTVFLVPRQFRLAQIFIAVPKGSDKAVEEKARAKLDAVEKKLKQNIGDFGAIAETESDDTASAKRDGEIGWLPETQIVPDIRPVALGLAKGGLSEPLRLDDGWHIVKLLDTKPAYTRPLSEVHDQIVQQLRSQKSMADRKAYLDKLLEQNPPEIDEIALAKLLPKAAASAAGQ